MPTWQIFPADGGHFRWSLAGGGGGGPDVASGGPDRETLAPRLPSMADLVLQAPSKLLEGRDRGGGEGAPTFRTGSGRSVSVRESSIRKARSLLDGGSDADRDVLESGGSKDNGFSMFRTGSGRSVTVKPSSLRKATTVLEREDLLKYVVEDDGSRDDDFSMFHTGSGKSVIVKQSSLRKATAVLEQEALQKGAGTVEQTGGSDHGFPMFRTGSGKSVMVKQSSIKKAVDVLEGDLSKKGVVEVADSNDCFPMFHTGSGKSVMIRQSSIRKAAAVLEGDIAQKSEVLKPLYCGANSDDVPKFQTGSGKSVMLKQSSIRKAMAILQDGENIETELLYPQSCGKNEDVPMFHNGAGKSVPLKQSSIRKAMAILQDGENIETDHATTFTAEGHHTFSNSHVHNGSGKTVNTAFSVVKNQNNVDEVSRNKENISFALLQQNAMRSCYPPKFPPPVPTFTSPMKSSTLSGTNFKGAMRNQKKDIGFCVEGIDQLNKCPPSTGQLMDISNFIHKDYANMSVLTNDKKRPWRRSSISPFKRPRICRFTTPVNNSISLFTTDSAKLSTSENHPCRTRLSAHYPFKFRRKTLKEFFGGPPTENNLFGQLPAAVRKMNADNAEIYRFCDSSGLSDIGPEAFQNILVQSGATSSSATNEWVANHYKWIVWKLACFERCYPAIACGKLLTASNVLEELKYRYEREVNYGHRSAIKKILDGDASPASMMVLCISSIHSSSAPRIGVTNDTNDLLGDGEKLRSSDEPEISHATKIELTDGCRYSLDAVLDVSLSKHLVEGKLFVGQKLRIWGAGLCGWGGPTSPLEASKTISLLVHMNGTYRAHWSSPLGFCKGLGVPLAFRCIKESGGKVPRTLVGVTRIYPILYKERFHDGGSIVRSERMESKVLQLYNQRRSNIAEDIMAEKHDELVNSSDSEEGAILYRILETSAEPDVLMADMSSHQLQSFSTYQAKQEAVRQTCMEKKIEKALEDACLSSRDVTPFMRVRVVGLTSKGSFKKGQVREGLITIWNPTEKQKLDLVEGQMYSVSGLIPRNFSSNILHLQAKGSSTVWEPLASVSDKFEPFFTARKAVPLSNLGEVPLASEFDIAGVVLHVGEVYMSGCRKKQWVFLTDGSRCISKIPDEELNDCVLAVSFCSPMSDNDTAGLLFPRLLGTIVGFCNLVKRAKDQMNHLWIGEATENSTYSVCYNLPRGFHLKEAADSAKIWAKESSSTIQKLRERILCIIGGHGS